jgi:ubiquinone/menaquinone biosynthesis C-methylase UbiE
LEPYSEEHYAWLREAALKAARVFVPFLMDLLRPESVVDVGCGTGEWLAVFQNMVLGRWLGWTATT